MRYEYDASDKLNGVEVTLAMGCKLDCRYCPQKLLLSRYFAEDGRRSAMMSFENFKKILEKVKKGGTICFSGMCEPFLNPECDDMIMYAYEKGFRVSLLTTLMGFKRECIEKLKNVMFDVITLHIPDEEGNSKFDITEEYLENLRLFHENFNISNYSCHGTVHPAVEPYIDKEKQISSSIMNRAGNLDCGKSSQPKGQIVCMVGTIGSYGNWAPEVLPDGTLLLCCMDYGMKHVLGNLYDMPVAEILNGTEYKSIQKGMFDDKLDVLCRKCTSAIEIKKTPAYQFKSAKQKLIENKQAEEKQKEILELFAGSKNICVFGLGKLFWDNFFHQKWNEVLGQTCFSDNSPELWGKEIKGIECIAPDDLKGLDELLVITHISDDKAVRRQLGEMGINNIVNINEIYSLF